MEYGKDKIIISEDSIRELIGFVMDVQDELTRKSQQLEMLERYYDKKPHFLTEEVKAILGIEDSANEVLKEQEEKEELISTPTSPAPF